MSTNSIPDVDAIIPGQAATSSRPWGITLREIGLGIGLAVAVVACIVLGIVLATNGTSNGGGTPGALGDNVCGSAECLQASSWVSQNLNQSVDPCTDFHTYACSRWTQGNPIPADRSAKTVTGDIANANYQKLRRLLNIPAQRSGSNSWERKVKGFYRSCMNDYIQETSRGYPLMKIISESGGWWVSNPNFASTTWTNFNHALKTIHIDFWTDVFFTFYVAPDPARPKTRIIEIDKGGLGMPWSYYISRQALTIQESYKTFMRTVGMLMARDSNLTVDDATRQLRVDTFVNDAYLVEFKLANITAYSLPSQKPHDAEQRVRLSDLNTQADQIDWADFFTSMFNEGTPVTSSSYVVVLEKSYIAGLNNFLKTLPFDQRDRMLNNYMVWRMAQTYVQDLSWDYIHANRDYYVSTTGNTEFLGKWRACFNKVQDKMGVALSGLFVRDHFSDAGRGTAHEMVTYLKQALLTQLGNLQWMDSKTLLAAIDKVKAIVDKIGYPGFMQDDNALDSLYLRLSIDDSQYFQNLLNWNKYEKSYFNYVLREGENRDEWSLNTYDTAAQFYNPWNELLVPAGMMQFPVFDTRLPMFMNFGSMGSILGYNLINSVDFDGGYYTNDGSFFDWWTNKTYIDWLRGPRDCMLNFYTNSTVGPFRVAGRLFLVRINAGRYLNEGIRDTYGLRQAYMAYKAWESANGPEKNLPGLGLTNDQAFFVAHAQANCFSRRDSFGFSLALRGHIPENFRVNGAMGQLEEFNKAFNCPAGSVLNVQPKCNMF